MCVHLPSVLEGAKHFEEALYIFSFDAYSRVKHRYDNLVFLSSLKELSSLLVCLFIL